MVQNKGTEKPIEGDIGGVYIVNRQIADYAKSTCSVDFIKESNSRIVPLLPKEKPVEVVDYCIKASREKFSRVFP